VPTQLTPPPEEATDAEGDSGRGERPRADAAELVSGARCLGHGTLDAARRLVVLTLRGRSFVGDAFARYVPGAGEFVVHIPASPLDADMAGLA